MTVQTLTTVALSIKQPWAGLVVAGLKTIEIRRWQTTRIGRILIHAARIPDDRPEAWRHIAEEHRALAQLQGGIIGAVELTRCVSYAELAPFVADQARHFNEPEWFKNPPLFGFVFANPERLPFQKYPGWFRFFPVKDVAKPVVRSIP